MKRIKEAKDIVSTLHSTSEFYHVRAALLLILDLIEALEKEKRG